MSVRRRIGVTAAAAAILLAGLLAWKLLVRPAPDPSAVGGAFHLVDQSGRAVDESLLRGKVSAVFFGYTFCPDVCPTTLSTLGRAMDIVVDPARGLQVVFITVDPERDTAKALAAYLASPSFPKATIGLTGTAAQVAAVARAYHVFYQKAPEAGGGYTMDHSSVVYLMDRGGRFIRPLDVSLPPPEVARQLRTALAGG